MITVFHNGVAPQGWDERLYACDIEAGICQSSFWSRIIQNVDQAIPLFLEAYRDGDGAVLASLLLFHKIPWDRCRKKKIRGLKELISGKWNGWLEWMDGPVIHTHDPEEAKIALDKLLQWVSVYAFKNKLKRIISFGFAQTSKWVVSEPAADIFSMHGYSVKKWGTFLINCDTSQDQLWKNLDKSARKAVDKAKNMGLEIKKMESWEEAKKLFWFPFYSLKGYSVDAIENLMTVAQATWQEDKQENCHLYIAELGKGEIIGTLGIYSYNGVATEICSALSYQAICRQLPAQDLLHWELILEAARIGCKRFNLAGVNPCPITKKEKGIRQFKAKWSGDYIEFNRFQKDRTFLSWFKKGLGGF